MESLRAMCQVLVAEVVAPVGRLEGSEIGAAPTANACRH